jgi:hypothetical protein
VKTEIKRGGEISGNRGTYGLYSHEQADQFTGHRCPPEKVSVSTSVHFDSLKAGFISREKAQKSQKGSRVFLYPVFLFRKKGVSEHIRTF